MERIKLEDFLEYRYLSALEFSQDGTHAAFVVYPSIACVRASIPVEAVNPFGIEAIISGSTTAMIGISCGSTQTNLRFFCTSVMT